MFWKCNGFTLLETLISLNIWFLLTFSLVPSLLQLEKERANLGLTRIANHLIQAEIYHYLYDGTIKTTDVKNINNRNYFITWDVVDGKMIKICVTWVNTTNHQNLRCGFGKK